MTESTRIRVRCPGCNAILAVSASRRGQSITCPRPSCGKSFIASADSAIPPSATPSQSSAPAWRRLSRRAILTVAAGAAVVAVVSVVGVSLFSRRQPTVDYFMLAALIADRYATDPAGGALPRPQDPEKQLGLPAKTENNLLGAYERIKEIRSPTKTDDVERVEQLGEQLGTTDLATAIKRALGSGSPVVRAGADKLQAGLTRADAIVQGAKGRAQEMEDTREKVRERYARGDVDNQEWTETREVVTEYPERTTIHTETITHSRDATADPILWAHFRQGRIFGEDITDMARDKILTVLDSARMEAWAEMLPRLGEVYGSVPAGDNLFTPRIIIGTNAAGIARPALALTNTGGRLLTNVTLRVELCPFEYAGHATCRQVLFLTRWPADATIYLTGPMRENLITAETDKRVRELARHPHAVRPEYYGRLDLANYGGVMEARLTAWAAEAHQPERAVKFPDRAELGARFESEFLSRVAERDVMKQAVLALRGEGLFFSTPPTPLLVPAEVKPLPAQSWVFPAASLVSTLAPGTDMARKAEEIRADPVGFVRQRRQKDLDLLLKASAPNRRWVGEWAFRLDQSIGMPSASDSATLASLKKVLNLHKGTKGRVLLEFVPEQQVERGRAVRDMHKFAPDRFGDTPQSRRVIARVSNLDRPDSVRVLHGWISTEREWKTLRLELTTGKPAPKTVKMVSAEEATAGMLAFDRVAVALELVCDGERLTGRAKPIQRVVSSGTVLGDQDTDYYDFELTLQPTTDAVVQEPRPADVNPPAGGVRARKSSPPTKSSPPATGPTSKQERHAAAQLTSVEQGLAAKKISIADAMTRLKTLIDKFPNTEAAKKAKKLLEELAP